MTIRGSKTWRGFLKNNMSPALKKYKNDRSKAMKYLGREWKKHNGGAKKNPSSLKTGIKKTIKGFNASKTGAKKSVKKRASKKYAAKTVYVKPRAEGGYNIYVSNPIGTSLVKKGYVLSIPDAKKWMRKEGHSQAILEK